MIPRDKPSIKDAIETCFIKTNQKYLDFGDFTFLLLTKQLKKYSTKEKKQKYQLWEKEFFTSVIGWMHPFKIFSFRTSYLAKVLKEMEKEQRLEKTDGGYSLYDSPFSYINAIRSKDKINIDKKENHIISAFDNLTLYGVLPFHQFENKENNKQINQVNSQVKKLFDKFIKIEKEFTTICLNQLKYILENGIKEIKKERFNEKDKKIAIKYLETIIPFPQKINIENWRKSFDEFNWINKKGKPVLHFLPDNHYISNQKLCSILKNLIYCYINFEEPKPIVFTPKLREKDNFGLFKMLDSIQY